MRKLSRFVLLALVVFLAGCASPTGESKPVVETKKWGVVNNNYQFYTNDTANYGYAYWNPFSNTNTAAVFTEMTGIAKKVTGAADQGYGFLFCYVNSDNFYRVLITTNGWFVVQKQVSNVWSNPPLRDWAQSTAIVQGFNQENSVQITRSSSAYFTVKINGITVANFTDTALTADGFAPVATIGDASNENFPTVPEDLRFRITSPAAKPSGAMASYSDFPANSKR